VTIKRLLGSAPSQVSRNKDLGKLAFQDIPSYNGTGLPAPTIASATTIAPLTPIVFVSGTTAIATITVAGGVVTEVEITSKGYDYTELDILTSASLDDVAGGTGFQLRVDSIINYVSLYQHEIGTDAISIAATGGLPVAIQSYFETSNLGWVSGGPAQQSAEGANYWLRLERVEPDFVQSGDMSLYVTGRPYAQAEDSTTGPYVFSPDTHKIDMKEQRRELRLKFESNVTGGNYQLGYLLLSADIGDVRGY